MQDDVTPKQRKEQERLITAEPNEWMSEYHDRMPVILHPDDIAEWLSPDTAPDQAQKLCRPWRGRLAFAN